MKICYSNPTLLMKRPVAEISQQANKKHKVTILTPKKLSKQRDKRLHYSDLKGMKVVSYNAVNLGRKSEWSLPGIGFLIKAWKALKENDVVHMWVPFYLSNTTIALLKAIFFPKKKLILTMDTIPGLSFDEGSWNKIYKIYYATLGKIVFSASDKITLYGESMRKYARKAGIPNKKIIITPTGVHLKTKKKDKDVKKEFSIKGKMIMFCGIMIPRKGVDILIKVAKKLPEYTFVLLGDGPKRKEYEEIVKKNKIKNIIFTGFRKDPYNFYQAADIFFLPSRGEGLAGVIMEALSYGVPVVSSKIPCTIDLVNNNYLCGIENVNDYVKKIKLAVKNNKKLSVEAKKSIKKFDWKKNIQGFLKLY